MKIRGLWSGVALPALLALGVLVGWHSLSAWSAAAPITLAAPVALTRGPYLQSVTQQTVVVVWETDSAGNSRVDYGPTASYGFSATNSTLVTHHAVTLTGLSPYATVHYIISTGGVPLEGDSTFRTAAAPTQTAFSFVAFGDTRTNDDAHQQVVDRIRLAAPDLVVHTGDMVADGTNTGLWTTFFSIEHDLLRRTPFFGSPGNHEFNNANYFNSFHLPGNERWYSFDYGTIHFISLEIDGYTDYDAESEQYDWLQNDLALTFQPWKVVFFHVPPYSSSAGHGSDLTVRQTLGPLFAQYGVDLVFNGHDHDYERSVVSDTAYIVTGGGGAPLSGQNQSLHPNPASVYFASVYHFVLVNVDGRCLSVAGVQTDGTRFDEFELCDSALFPLHYYVPVVFR